MLYRVPHPSDAGFDSAQDEFNAMREYAQNMMDNTDPHDVMDTLLMLANVCEMRALVDSLHRAWWVEAGQCVRAIILMLNTDAACPNVKLENPMLYFPEVKDVV